MKYSKEELFEVMQEFEETNGRLPSRRDTRNLNIKENAFYAVFGSMETARYEYNDWKNNEVVTDKRAVKDSLIDTLKANLTEAELKTLVASTSHKLTNKPKLNSNPLRETGHIKFIATGDSHIGHSKFRQDWWNEMVERGVKENVDFMYHTGDILEGMSGRPGHVYELEKVGFEAQFGLAKELINQMPFDIRMITGNHDNWYTGKADQGINVGARLEESCNNVVFLGNDEADDLIGGIKVKLWHGNDGASYAYSYRTQKFVEMLYGGEKPNILLAGHAHKAIFYENRNIQIFETGTTCMQTGFMRGKKLAAHTGYWIVDVWTNENGVARIRPEWNPFYI